jgi:hypothetical protein
MPIRRPLPWLRRLALLLTATMLAGCVLQPGDGDGIGGTGVIGRGTARPGGSDLPRDGGVAPPSTEDAGPGTGQPAAPERDDDRSGPGGAPGSDAAPSAAGAADDDDDSGAATGGDDGGEAGEDNPGGAGPGPSSGAIGGTIGAVADRVAGQRGPSARGEQASQGKAGSAAGSDDDGGDDEDDDD